jgi:hypothetical protein
MNGDSLKMTNNSLVPPSFPYRVPLCYLTVSLIPISDVTPSFTLLLQFFIRKLFSSLHGRGHLPRNQFLSVSKWRIALHSSPISRYNPQRYCGRELQNCSFLLHRNLLMQLSRGIWIHCYWPLLTHTHTHTHTNTHTHTQTHTHKHTHTQTHTHTNTHTHNSRTISQSHQILNMSSASALHIGQFHWVQTGLLFATLSPLWPLILM